MKHFKDRYPIMILHLSLTNLTSYHLFFQARMKALQAVFPDIKEDEVSRNF